MRFPDFSSSDEPEHSYSARSVVGTLLLVLFIFGCFYAKLGFRHRLFLSHTAMHQRIPSPRELQVHTQNILQRALIKKKLEEQQENFRKKQELQLQQQQRGQSPNNNNNNGGSSATVVAAVAAVTKSVSSPTPLAFTPTSVLRKMTADKEDGRDGGKDLVKGLGQQQGRAVTGSRPPQVQQQQNPIQQQWNTQYNIKQTGE